MLMGFAWASDRESIDRSVALELTTSFGIARSGNHGWKDPHAYGCVAAGSASFIICLIYGKSIQTHSSSALLTDGCFFPSAEWKGTKTGFLHHSLFQDGRNFPIAIFVIAVEGSLFYLINNIYVRSYALIAAELKRCTYRRDIALSPLKCLQSGYRPAV
jgi:hypothetical protein